MAESKRLGVLKALCAHLETISIANGYNYDLAGAVFRGRNRFGDNDPYPMVSILENPRPDYGQFVGEKTTRKDYWPLLLQGWTADDPQNPSDPVYGLLDDIQRCLARLIAENERGLPQYPDEYLLGRKIVGVSITPGVVRPPTDGVSSRAFFYLPFAIELVEDLA